MNLRTKLALTLIILFFGLSSFADERVRGLPFMGSCEVVSKKKVEHMTDGFYQLSGIIYNQNKDSILSGVIITNADQSVSAKSNGQGMFRAQFPIEDSIIYFFKVGLNETVTTFSGDRNKFHYQCKVVIADPMPTVVFKPVIYAYNTDEALLNILPKGEFTFTYPELKEGWRIQADEKGSITDLESSKEYPYLFWEAEQFNLQFLSQKAERFNQYYLKTDGVSDFLEAELTKAGLNYKERADFITFWGPKVAQYEHVRLQFLLDKDYQSVAEIEVEPKPQSMRRIYILIEEIGDLDNKEFYNKPLEWPAWDRDGFHILEWGGSDLTKTTTHL